MSQDLQDKTLELINKFEQIAQELTPEVVDIAFFVARISGLKSIIIGVFFAIVCTAFLRAASKIRAKYNESILSENWEDDDAYTWVVFITCAIIVGSISAILLLNLWSYVAIISPEVYIGHKILGW